MNKGLACMSVLFGAGMACAGPHVSVTSWRGETQEVLVHACEIAEKLPSGITIRTGALQPVRFLESPRALRYGMLADRLVWGAKIGGPRVAEIAVASETKAGTYNLGELTLTVVDRVLPPPAEWKYFLDLWQHPWAVARARGIRPFSREHYAAMRAIYEPLAAAGQKCLTITLTERPWNAQCYDAYHAMVVKRRAADGSWSYDFSLFDDYVNFGRSCGLGPKISCYTMCPWGYRVDYVNEKGETVMAEAKPGTSFFEAYWGAFLPVFAEHLRTKGWLADAYIAMDERSDEDVMAIGRFVAKVAPDLQLSMAGSVKPSDYKDVKIANYSCLLNYMTDAFIAEGQSRAQQGLVTTCYVCCGPQRPNTFMTSAAAEPFWCGFYPATCGLSGFLRWAWNSWGEDACTDASYGTWTSGDTFLIYPDGSLSWRFVDLKAGIRAAEKFRIMRETGIARAECDVLIRRFDRKAALEGTCSYENLRAEVLRLVNAP